MGNKSSAVSDVEDSDELSFEISGIIDADTVSNSTNEQFRSRRASVVGVNKEVAELFDSYKEVFLKFNELDFVEKLTDGFFENVYRGYYGYTEKQEVLIKLPFNQRFTIPMAKKLAKEGTKFVHLRHENIVRLMGFGLSSEQIFIVFEFCHGGSLLSALQKNSTLSLRQLGTYALDIAKGMHYLASKNVIHGNLCAAVCLLDVSGSSTAIVKISDFIHPTVFDYCEFSVFPLRWCAPETIATGGGNTSQSADVWSFGITLWELFSGGKQPYPKIGSNLVLQEHLLQEIGVHERPDRMPQSFYETTMVPCLNYSAWKRPSFAVLVSHIEAALPTLSDVAPEKQQPPHNTSLRSNTK